MSDAKLKAALVYAGLGWKVFPLHSIRDQRCTCGDAQCHSPGKHPRITRQEGGRGLDDGTTDTVTIMEWWKAYPDANVGIATGQFSNLLVIDIDGKLGRRSWGELTDAYGHPVCSLASDTGSGGMHLLFSYPSGFELGNTAGKLGPGIDTRGNRGYIVAPPSNHISGGEYRWHNSPTAELTLPPEWVIALLSADPGPAVSSDYTGPRDMEGTFWVNKALNRVTPGQRNNVGFWLATQLRDAGVSLANAEHRMRAYQMHVESMASPPYTWSEANASLQSAYKQPPRDNAVSREKLTSPKKPEVPQEGDVTDELHEWMSGVESGKIQNIPWPHPIFTHMTQSLLPGSLVTIVGDPGVGKTYWACDNLIHLDSIGVPYSALFLEKDRRFYAQRILASLAGDGRITTYTDIARHPEVWREAMREHRNTLRRIGANVMTRERGVTYTPRKVGELIRAEAEKGKRIIYLDPVTAMVHGREPWVEDQWFVQDECQSIAEDHGCSIIFITHPVKERPQKGTPSGHGAAGGSAWFRFVDSQIWLSREDPPEQYRIQTLDDGPQHMKGDVIVTAIKTRDGTGAGRRFLFNFERLRYRELGIILGLSGEDQRAELSDEEIGRENNNPGKEYGL